MRAPPERAAALAAAAALAFGAGAVGVTHAAFSGGTANAANSITAAPDFRPPVVSPLAIAKTSGGAAGYLAPGGIYRVYAKVTESGNPPSGVASVTANLSAITAGQTAVQVSPGSFTVDGVTYNYRSGLLNADAGLASGSQPFTVTATDAAANSATASGSVVIDATRPFAADVQAANSGGGPIRNVGPGDSFTLTYSEPIEPGSLLSGWTGATTTVNVRLKNGGAGNDGDRLEIWNAAQSAQVQLGSIALGRHDYLNGQPVWFFPGTMTMSGSTITIVIGGTVSAPDTATGSATMVWDPSTAAIDLAGNALLGNLATESGPLDSDF